MANEQEFPAVVDLNVGGRHFTTHLLTLTKEPDSMLAAMFSGRQPCSKDKDGRFFIDVDGDIFCHILNYLRFNKLNRLPSGDIALLVYEQACYFGLQSLISCLESYSSVQLEKYLEEIRTAYPWYRDITDNIFEQLKNMQLKRFRASASIHIRGNTGASEAQICVSCRNMVWKAVADGDPLGDALDFLIRHELEKRNFKVRSYLERCFNYHARPQGYYHEVHNNQCYSQNRTIEVKF